MEVIVKEFLSHDSIDYQPSEEPQDVKGLTKKQAEHLEGLGVIEILKSKRKAADE